MSGTPYIGSKISLISKAQIRYDGILYSIDTVNSTLALARVKSYGTEHRPSNRPVPPKHYTFEYIIFRGRDIKDITVCEPPKSLRCLPHDPAFLQSSIGSSSDTYLPQTHYNAHSGVIPNYNQLDVHSLFNQQYATALALGLQGLSLSSGAMVEHAVQTVPVVEAAQKRGQPASKQQSRESSRSQSQRKPGARSKNEPGLTASQRGNSENRTPKQRQGNRRIHGRGQLLVDDSKTTTLHFESDFDFDTANAQFCKDDLPKKLEDQVIIKEAKVDFGVETPTSGGMAEEDSVEEKLHYDRNKCFFDGVSADLKPRRTTWAEEKKLNMETFGVPGRLLRDRGFRRGSRGRKGPSRALQQPRPKVGRGSVKSKGLTL
ncbi:protein LSM14 homolog B-like [Osmerus mordax]|uniref:protein LSM14 homolog B-like n=1 Tax=Osmerus mordax TaxID=8014 RepID=UPI00350FCEEC